MQVVGDRLVGLYLGQQLMHRARQLLHLIGGHPQIGTRCGVGRGRRSGLGESGLSTAAPEPGTPTG